MLMGNLTPKSVHARPHSAMYFKNHGLDTGLQLIEAGQVGIVSYRSNINDLTTDRTAAVEEMDTIAIDGLEGEGDTNDGTPEGEEMDTPAENILIPDFVGENGSIDRTSEVEENDAPEVSVNVRIGVKDLPDHLVTKCGRDNIGVDEGRITRVQNAKTGRCYAARF